MFSHLKRRIGVLTAVAVVAALAPIMSMSPASAAANVLTVEAVSAAATYSACPGTSAPAAGFTDTTSTDVDCIKMHGITTGVTATTYEPAASIPRWQMALYLTRAAVSMGHTLGSGADQGFTDISGYAADIQTAINQLAQLTVTLGTTATTFSPDDNVTREQMAMFIERLLGLTTPGPGGSTLLTKVGVAVGGYNYTDIDSGAVTFEGHNAILELFELGVTGDTAALALTYRPAADMTRAEMATFMTNALAHSNARPEGLHLQTSFLGSCSTCFGAMDPQLHISHRDASRQPITGTLVDVFSDLNTTLTNTAPFGATGACTTTNTDNEGGATECTISVGDNSTDSFGNIAVNPTDTATGTTRNYWAWTGATGATYNNLTAPGSTVGTTTALVAASLALSEDVPTYALVDGTDANHYFVPFGTTITVTGQLKNALGLATAQALTAVSVAEVVTIDNDLGDGTVANEAAGTMASAKTTVLYTDASGAISYTITQADPSALATDLNRTQVVATFTSSPAAVNADGASTTAVKLSFNDDDAYNGSVSLTQGSYYGIGLPLALGGVARTASASVWDQYGRARANQTVTFEQTTGDGAADNLTDSFTDDITRVTNSSGVATLGFSDVNTATGMHTIWAWYEGTTNGTRASNAAEPEASSIFYRVESNDLGSQTYNATSTEVDAGDANEVGGNGAAVTCVATTGVCTAAADHNLDPGESMKISVTCGGGATMLVGTVLYVLLGEETASGGTANLTFTAALTRGGSTHIPAANETACQMQQLEVWEGSDVLYEIVYWDDANNTIVVRHQTATAGAAAYDYNAYVYEADDQFMTNADNADSVAGPAVSLVTLAGFELEVKSKMTLASGYTRPSTAKADTNDVYKMVYVNNLADGGISQFQLGQ
jgi:hypothetical protein